MCIDNCLRVYISIYSPYLVASCHRQWLSPILSLSCSRPPALYLPLCPCLPSSSYSHNLHIAQNLLFENRLSKSYHSQLHPNKEDHLSSS